MRRSTDRILVTHVGALPAPEELWVRKGVDAQRVAEEVSAVVVKQREAGVDFINEGEGTKGGNWVVYVNSRISGYQPATEQGATWKLMMESADWREFADFYRDRLAAGTLFEESHKAPSSGSDGRLDWECVEPLQYVGQKALQASIQVVLASLGTTPASDAFITSTAPMSIEVGRANRFYRSEEEYVQALAETLRIEYEGIADAGLQVQIDDAWMAALWDRIGIPMGIAAYKRHFRFESKHLITRFAMSQKPKFDIICVGEAGMDRMPTICQWPT